MSRDHSSVETLVPPSSLQKCSRIDLITYLIATTTFDKKKKKKKRKFTSIPCTRNEERKIAKGRLARRSLRNSTKKRFSSIRAREMETDVSGRDGSRLSLKSSRGETEVGEQHVRDILESY